MKILYNIKWSFKQFSKYPLQSLINIVGLSIGLTVFILICLYINYQNNVDKFHANVESIYRIEHGFGGVTPATYSDFYKEKIPEVKYAARLAALDGLIHYQDPNSNDIKQGVNVSIGMTDKDFFNIFTYPFIKGDLNSAFEQPSSIILTKSIAEKLFGETDPINKVITYDSNHELVVKGVIDDVPKNSSYNFAAIIPVEFYKTFYGDPDFLTNWGRWMYETYFIFQENADIAKLQNEFKELVDQKLKDLQSNYNKDLILKSYSDIYFSEVMDRHSHGNKKHVVIFSIVALFVLLIACINYVNITTALASNRFKALGIQKISGASRFQVIRLILHEGIITAFLAVILSVFLTEFTLPYFRDLTFLDIQIPYSFGLVITIFILLPLVLGAIAGLYPSIYLSKFDLTKVVKGEIIKGKSGAMFRKVLTILQFTISVFLIIGTLVVKKQLNYINDFDPGFKVEQIGFTFINSPISKHFDVFKERLLQNKDVLGVTRCNNFITNAGSWTSVYDGDDKSITAHYFSVDEDFFKVFEIEFEKGRDFDKNDLKRSPSPYIINKKLADWYGSVDTSLTKQISNGEIVGVIKDIQSNDLYSEPTPSVFHINPNNAFLIYFKINSENYKETISYIESVWSDIAMEYPFEFNFLDESFERSYRSEIQFARVFMIFAVISILLACLGLFALASFLSLRRTKEIGIRKALGSSTRKITFLLSKELTSWVIIANIIAAPLAYYFMNKWLNSFAYKTELSWWIFVFAIVVSLLIALLTIFYHTMSTARKNPVESLRYE